MRAVYVYFQRVAESLVPVVSDPQKLCQAEILTQGSKLYAICFVADVARPFFGDANTSNPINSEIVSVKLRRFKIAHFATNLRVNFALSTTLLKFGQNGYKCLKIIRNDVLSDV